MTGKWAEDSLHRDEEDSRAAADYAADLAAEQAFDTPRLIHHGDTVVLYWADLVLTVHRDGEAAYSLLMEGSRESVADVVTVSVSAADGRTEAYQL